MGVFARASDVSIDRPYPRRWYGLGVLCFSLLIIVMANMSLAVAAPQLTLDLHLTSSNFQWIVDGYTVPYASLMLILAAVGDKYGRRKALLVGLVFVVIGSVVGINAHSSNDVIAARVIMGTGAAMIMPATLALLVAMFPRKERSLAIAIWGSTTGIAMVTGPLVVGFLLQKYNWTSAFYLNIPIVVLLTVLVFFVVPPSKAIEKEKIDYLGGLLSVAWIGATVYCSIQGPHFGWDNKAYTGLGVAIASFIIFIIWELYYPHPLFDLRKFKNRLYAGALLATAVLMFLVFSTFFAILQQLMFVFSYSPLKTGLSLVPLVLTVGLGNVVTAFLSRRLGVKVVIPFGLLFAAASFFLMTRFHADANFWTIITPLYMMGFSIGLVIAPSTDIIMGSFTESKFGIGGALNDTALEMGGSLGIAILGSVLSSGYANVMHGSISRYAAQLTAAFAPRDIHRIPLKKLNQLKELQQQLQTYRSSVEESVGGGWAVTNQAHNFIPANITPAEAAQIKGIVLKVQDYVADGFIQGIVRMGWVGFVIALIGALIVFLILPAYRGTIEEQLAASNRKNKLIEPDLDPAREPELASIGEHAPAERAAAQGSDIYGAPTSVKDPTPADNELVFPAGPAGFNLKERAPEALGQPRSPDQTNELVTEKSFPSESRPHAHSWEESRFTPEEPWHTSEKEQFFDAFSNPEDTRFIPEDTRFNQEDTRFRPQGEEREVSAPEGRPQESAQGFFTNPGDNPAAYNQQFRKYFDAGVDNEYSEDEYDDQPSEQIASSGNTGQDSFYEYNVDDNEQEYDEAFTAQDHLLTQSFESNNYDDLVAQVERHASAAAQLEADSQREIEQANTYTALAKVHAARAQLHAAKAELQYLYAQEFADRAGIHRSAGQHEADDSSVLPPSLQRRLGNRNYPE